MKTKKEINRLLTSINIAESYLQEPQKFVYFCEESLVLKDYSVMQIKGIINIKHEYFDFNFFKIGYDYENKKWISADNIKDITKVGKRLEDTHVEAIPMELYQYYINHLR